MSSIKTYIPFCCTNKNEANNKNEEELAFRILWRFLSGFVPFFGEVSWKCVWHPEHRFNVGSLGRSQAGTRGIFPAARGSRSRGTWKLTIDGNKVATRRRKEEGSERPWIHDRGSGDGRSHCWSWIEIQCLSARIHSQLEWNLRYGLLPGGSAGNSD